MKTILSFSLCLLATSLFAQDESKITWSIHYNAGPATRYIDVNSNYDPGDITTVDYPLGFYDRESSLVSHQVSAQGIWENGRKLRPVAGLSWTVYRFYQDNNNLTFGDMIDPRQGFIYEVGMGDIESVEFTRQYQYLRLPLGINYTIAAIGGSKIETQLTISPDLLLRTYAKRTINYEDGADIHKGANYDENIETLGLTTQLDINYVNPMSRAKELVIGVTGQFNPRSQYIGDPYIMHWGFAGLNLGVRF